MSSEKSSELKNISGRISCVRNGLSVKLFAQKLGVSPAYIYDLEAGKKTNISDTLALLISAQFNVNLTWVLSGEGPMHPDTSSADRITETENSHGLDKFLVKALSLLSQMDEDSRQDVLRLIEGQKLWQEQKKRAAAADKSQEALEQKLADALVKSRDRARELLEREGAMGNMTNEDSKKRAQ